MSDTPEATIGQKANAQERFQVPRNEDKRWLTPWVEEGVLLFKVLAAAKLMGREGTFEGMARIALNGRLLVPESSRHWSSPGSRRELVRLRPHDEFLLVVDQPHDEMFEMGPNVEVRRMLILAVGRGC